MPPAETVAFVLCIEANAIRDQALLLIESIRAFAGRLADSEIFAVAPRAFLGVDAGTRERLTAMQVTYHEEALNTVCPWYGSANRIYAAAWAAVHSNADVLIVLDSDTLVLGEPELPGDDTDLAVRPVGVKGCASSGPDDPCEPYWRSFCALAGMPVSDLPWVETTIDRQIVRASYNGGYAAIRRRSGIAEQAANLFTRSLAAGLLPTTGNAARVVSSTGRVSSLASRYWGSNQAAVSIAAWSTTRRVRLLDRRTNVPLHCLADAANWHDGWRDVLPLHVHYHWMLEPPHRTLARELLARIGVGAGQLAWLDAHAFAAPAPPQFAVGTPPAHATASSEATSGRQLVICGMHRAGTSLVGSVLQRAGLDGGRQMDPASAGNLRGQFADLDVLSLHEAMLAAAGHTGLTADQPLTTPGASFEAHARRLIGRRADQPLWVFEDPRADLFLDFWQRLLPAPSYLMLYRHPVDAILSLWRRGGDPELWHDPWQAVRTWELHHHALLAFRARHPERCFLAQVPAVADLPGLVRRVRERFHIELRADAVGELLAAAEPAPPPDDGGPAWRDVIANALDLYERLEQAADWPATASTGPAATRLDRAPVTDSHERRLSETLLYTLLGGPAPAAVPWRAEEPTARRADLEPAGRVAELERALAAMAAERADIAAHRDELARALTAIETSRAFWFVHAWWALRQRLAGAPARPPTSL